MRKGPRDHLIWGGGGHPGVHWNRGGGGGTGDLI